MTIDEIIERAQRGDEAAVNAFVEHVTPLVFRFGKRMCQNDADAQEVAQETLLAAWRTLSGFRRESSVPTWLFTIARSFCIKKRRKSDALTVSEGDAELAADTDKSPHEKVEESHFLGAVQDALALLDDSYREVIVLRDVEGLSANEVAQVTGLTVDAVKSRLHRARKALRSQLEPWMEPPDPSCPDVLAMYSIQREGELDQTLCAQLQAHVDSCPRCAGQCESLKNLLNQCAQIPAPAVPLDLQRRVREGLANAMRATARS